MSTKINFASLLRKYHFAVVIVVAAVLLSLEGWFLFKYFYRAMAQSRTIRETRAETALEELQMETFTRLDEFHKQKKNSPPVQWLKFRDPFIESNASAPRQ